jgi:DNA mismatch endonuclease (patch repair protein)
LSDVHSPAQRSFNMSQIRGKNTRPEILLRKSLWHLGLRYRLSSKLPGKPDLVFPRFRAVLFVDGCFWHGCPTHLSWPKKNARFWEKKILGNKDRDSAVNRELKRGGWMVIRVWEHQIRLNLTKCALRIKRKLRR